MIDSICMRKRNNIYSMVVLRSSIDVRKKNTVKLLIFNIVSYFCKRNCL